MGRVHIVSIDRLRVCLREALGLDSLLFRRFDAALRQQDQVQMSRAMEILRLHPQEIREQVDEILLAWLFSLDGPGSPDREAAADGDAAKRP